MIKRLAPVCEKPGSICSARFDPKIGSAERKRRCFRKRSVFLFSIWDCGMRIFQRQSHYEALSFFASFRVIRGQDLRKSLNSVRKSLTFSAFLKTRVLCFQYFTLWHAHCKSPNYAFADLAGMPIPRKGARAFASFSSTL